MTDGNDKAGLDALAEKVYGAWKQGELLDLPPPEDLPQDFADAYYVQDREIALTGKEPRAWKLGASSKAAQAIFGLDEPFTGPVLEGRVLQSPATVDVSGFGCHIFEPEIAITLGRDIDSPIDVEEARAAIASLHPAIEVVNFRFRDGGAKGVHGMIADLGTNGALVLGPPAPPGADDYWTMTLDVRVNGKSVAERTPPPPETDMGELLSWFSGHLAARGYSLRKGDAITTGSQGGVLPYQPGDFVEADFGKAGMATVQF